LQRPTDRTCAIFKLIRFAINLRQLVGPSSGRLRLAVNSQFKSQSGERKEETCFVTVVVWARQAETCNQYLKKGRPVLVEGRLISRSWEAEGKTRTAMEVRADRVQFMGSAPARREGGSESSETLDEPVAESAADAGGDEVPF